MISIYTHTNNPLKKEFWKYIAKKAIGKYGGPDAVLDSLTRGLTELEIPFEVNPFHPKFPIIHVLSGVEVLREMITKKQQHLIQKLIVGPTLVTTPYDYNNIIQSPEIDAILFPSQWTKDFYVNLVPTLAEKIHIWPAGVYIPKESSIQKNILLFKKHIPEHIYNHVIKTLKNKGLSYDILTYGTYNKKTYHAKLRSASVLIYLQSTESQGLALQEAWSYNVPTLVWENTIWKDRQYTWTDSRISAPYLTDEAGLFFTLENFNTQLETIITHKKIFQPKQYCAERLSDKASANTYIDILKTYVT